MNTLTRLTFIMLIVTFAMPFSAEARYPRGSILTGTVRSVDVLARSVVFVEDGGAIRKFVWTSYAQLWRDDIDSSPSTLKPGMRLRITLHDPLFGEDSVSQMGLLPSSTKAGTRSGK